MDSRRRELLSGGVDPSISISVSTLNFDADSSTASFTVTSNTDWTLSGANSGWYTASPVSGGRGTTTITINVTANTSDSNTRVGTISAITRKRNVTAELTVIQIPDWITTATYTISNISASPTTGIAAGGGTSTISGGAGSIVYEWKSGKADTTGTFTPNKTVARTSGSTSGSASISGNTVTVNSLGSNLYNGNTVFTVTYSYNPGNPPDSRTTVVNPSAKTCTVTQNKNIVTNILMSNPGGGAIPDVNYGAGAETKSFTSTAAASNPGITLVFSSTSSIAGTTTHGTLSGPTYSWASSNTNVATLTSANAASLNVTSVTRGTTYGTSARTSVITRTASYTYTLNSTYSAGATINTQSASTSCTGTATQAANLVAVTSITPAAGAIAASVSFAAGGETKTWASTTAAAVGTATLTFDSGSTVSEGSSPTYGTWSGPAYAWSSNQTYFTVSSSTAAASVTAADRGTTLGAARTATITRSATIVYTLKSNYTNSGRTSTQTKTVSCTGTATQAANEVTYSMPQYKGLKYDQAVPAAGGLATLQAPDGYIQYATYTSGSVVEITSGGATTYARAEEVLRFDPEFFNGINGVGRYDNNGSGRTTVTRVNSDIPTGMPNNSNYALKINYNPDASTKESAPYLGGWALSYGGTAGQTYVCTFNAWIPEGYSLSWHTNPIGSGGTSSWTSPYEGKGRWMTYGRKVTFGTSPSTSFYFALIGPKDVSVNWYIGSVYLAKVTDVTGTGPAINTTNGSVTLDSKGTAISDYSQIPLGTIYHTLTLNGKTADIVIGPEQMPNHRISTDASAQGYVANISIGSGIGPGTSCSNGTSAAVTYSASHTAWDQYSSTAKNNQHTVYDQAVVTKTTDANNKFTLSGTTTASGSSNTCTIGLGNMGTTATTYSVTLTCTNNNSNQGTKATKTASTSGTNSLTSYSNYSLTSTKSTSNNVPVGGTDSYYATITSTKKPNYSSGCTGSDVLETFKITNITNCTLWSAAGGTGTQYTTSSTGLTSGTKIYIKVGTNYNTQNTRTVSFTVQSTNSSSTTHTVSWTQTADTLNFDCSVYSITLTNSANSIPCAGTSKTIYTTVGITCTPKYIYQYGGTVVNGTATNTGTVSLSGSNMTPTNASGTTISTATNETKVYWTVTSNGVTAHNVSTSSTRNCSLTASITGCSTYTQNTTITQAKDTSSLDGYTYKLGFDKSESAVPEPVSCSGLTSATKYAKITIQRAHVYKWATGSGRYIHTTDNTGTASLNPNPGLTCCNSSGTTISTITNNNYIYVKVDTNYNTLSGRCIDLIISLQSDYTASVSELGDGNWQNSWYLPPSICQSPDTLETDYYKYTVSWGGWKNGSSSVSTVPVGGTTTIFNTCNISRSLHKKYVHGGGAYGYSGTDNGGSVTVTGTGGMTGISKTTTAGTTTSLTGITNGQKIYLNVPCRGAYTTTRTLTLTPSAGVTAASSGNTYNTASINQAANSSSSAGYKYTASITKSGTYASSNIPAAGLSSGTAIGTLNVSVVPMYSWQCGSDTSGSSTTGTSSNTVTLTGTNCTLCTSASGTFAASITAYNGQTIYMKATCNGQTTYTRSIKINPSAGASAYSSGNTYTAQSWTQNGDTNTVKYEYQASITKSGTYASANIPAAGLTSETSVGTVSIQSRPVYIWNTCGGVTKGDWSTATTAQKVTFTGTNCTLNTSSSGTFAASKSLYNGQTVYIKVSCNGGNGSAKNISIVPSGGYNEYSGGEHAYTTTTWTQAADTISFTKYSYTVTLTKQNYYTDTLIPVGGLTSGTNVAKVNVSVVPYNTWAACGTVTTGSSTTGGTANTVTVTGTNCTLSTSASGTFGSTGTFYNGQAVYIKVSSNSESESTRTITLATSAGADASTGGHSYGSKTWTQAADTKTLLGYVPHVSFTDNYGNNRIPCAGLSKTKMATVSVTLTPYYQWTSTSNIVSGTTITGGSSDKVKVHAPRYINGNNWGSSSYMCTSQNGTYTSGNAGIWVYNGQSIYLTVGNLYEIENSGTDYIVGPYLNESSEFNLSKTLLPYSSYSSYWPSSNNSYGSENYLNWTHAGDTYTTCYEWKISFTKDGSWTGTTKIPLAGDSAGKRIATVMIQRRPKNTWAGRGTITYGSWSNTIAGLTLRVNANNCTIAKSTGTTVPSSGWATSLTVFRGNYIFLKPGNNNLNTNTREITITADGKDCTDNPGGETWTQAADSITSTSYKYQVTFNKSGTYASTNIPNTGLTSATSMGTVSVKYKGVHTWNSGETVTDAGWSNATNGSGKTVTLAVTNGTLNTSTASSGFAASKSGIYNGQTIYFKINANDTSSTRTITLSSSNGASAASSGNEYGSATWTQAAQTLTLVGYQYALTENVNLFEQLDNMNFESSAADTCEEYIISHQVQLTGPINHTVQVRRRPIYQSTTAGTQSPGSWENYTGTQGSTAVECYAYNADNENWNDESTWRCNDANGFYVYSDNGAQNRVTSFVSAVTINSIYVFSNYRSGNRDKSLHVQYVMNTSYPNMITSGEYASTRTLNEDSRGFFNYMQEGDFIQSTTYGNISVDNWSNNTNWNWYHSNIGSEGDGTYWTTSPQGLFAGQWKPFDLDGVFYTGASGSSSVTISVGANDSLFDPGNEVNTNDWLFGISAPTAPEELPSENTINVPVIPIGTNIYQARTYNWSCSGAETGTLTLASMGGTYTSPTLTDNVGIMVSWPSSITYSGSIISTTASLQKKSSTKTMGTYYVNTNNIYTKEHIQASPGTIVITGKGGKTYSITMYAILQRGLRIAHYLDLRDPRAEYHHIEMDPYFTLVPSRSVSVSSNKYGTASGYWNKVSLSGINNCYADYGSTKFTIQLSQNSSDNPGTATNPILTIVSNDAGNTVPDISLTDSSSTNNNRITSQLGGFPASSQHFDGGWNDTSAWAIFSSGTETYSTSTTLSLQPDKTHSIIGISDMLNVNPGSSYFYGISTNDGINSSCSSYDILFNNIYNMMLYWLSEGINEPELLTKGTINMPISIHKLSASYPYAHVAAITKLGKTSGGLTWLPASINPFNVPSTYNYSFTSTDIVNATTPYYNGSVFDYSCNSSGNTILNLDYNETRGFWVLLIPMGFSWPVWYYASGAGIVFSRSGSNIITQAAAWPDPQGHEYNIAFANAESVVEGTGTNTNDEGTKYSNILCGYNGNHSYYPISCNTNHAISTGLVTQKSVGYNNGGNNISAILTALRKPFGILCRFDTAQSTSTGVKTEYLIFYDAKWGGNNTKPSSNNTRPGRITIRQDGIPTSGGGS